MRSALHYYLAAAHAAHITPRQFHEWLQVFPCMQYIFHASVEEWQSSGLNPAQIQSLSQPDWAQVDKSLAWAQRKDCHILTFADSDYPVLLREISDPPLVLFIRGDPSLLSAKQLAIVGARDMTPYAEKCARTFASSLAQAGLVITSGMALGVDGAAHRATLEVNGRTIAVAGTGLLYSYPRSHSKLAEDIAGSGGALVSEFPLSSLPSHYHFPRRNRIISGMSIGVLVVEAAIKSGSLITARHAVEQGREVFAIPGHITNPMARGCHALIRQGAKLVETAADILEEFGMDFSLPAVEISPAIVMMPPALNIDEQNVYNHIGYSVTPLDEIILRSGLTASAVSSILLSMELRSLVKAISGGYVKAKLPD